ncbi:MAG: type II secretion system protein GspM [Betaproteobacteria bacterium]
MATLVQPSLRDRARRWWLVRTPQERVVSVVLAGAVVAALLWLSIWQPMQRDVERLTRALAFDRNALAEARRRADDIATLTRSNAPRDARDARADLDAALSRAGIKPSSIDRADGDRYRIGLDNIGFGALVALLDALQREARLRAVDLAVTGRVEPGQVRAELTLAP